MTRTTYENLEQRLVPILTRNRKEGRPMIPVRQQLLSVIWLLATPDSFRSVADRFNMGKSILHDSFRRVVYALNDSRFYYCMATRRQINCSKEQIQ